VRKMTSLRFALAAWLPALLFVPVTAAQPGAFAASECFPFERLPATLRSKAEDTLLKALDGEALYTIAGGLKPMSSGFVSASIAIDAPDLTETESLRQELNAWTCGGELAATVHHFAQVYQGKRSLEAVVFHRPALRTLLTRHAAFFSPYGLSASSDPIEVVMTVEYDPTPARFRGYGYLFGYPDYAVDFFVQASITQQEREKNPVPGVEALVPRDFVSLPTVRGERRFVYAVPKGHVANEADAQLTAATDALFADYSARRARHIKGNSAAGVLALVREWFDNGKGDVRPSNVRRPRTP
jgi:hypothetical protein